MAWDIIIIGGGPGGLQAAIAAASEGLKVVVVEKGVLGGQIGQTPKLENSVFANGGISGPEFAAMMTAQALAMNVTFKRGTVFNLKRMNTGLLEVRITPPRGTGMEVIDGHLAIVAVGNRWREIDVPGLKAGLQRGDVHFGPVKSINFPGKGGFAAVYGGGPSAGQAILELANNPGLRGVHAFMRSNLNMPEYLADRIRQHARVRLVEQTTLAECTLNRGGHGINVVTTRSDKTPVEALFLCNGLLPDTEWINVMKDEEGRILTGAAAGRSRTLETSLPGVFAIGDCRSGSTPRVGSAIGEGSMAISEIWQYLLDNPVCEICPRLLGKKRPA